MNNRKQIIIKAFIDLLKESSILEVSNEDIIKKAQVSKRTFYNYFNNTDEIIDFLQDEAEKNFVAPIEEKLKNFYLKEVSTIPQILNIGIELLLPVMEHNNDMLSELNDANLNFLWMTPLFHVYINVLSQTNLKNENSDLIKRLLCYYFASIISTWVQTKDQVSLEEFRKMAYGSARISLSKLLED